jgi:hypothetical protein
MSKNLAARPTILGLTPISTGLVHRRFFADEARSSAIFADELMSHLAKPLKPIISQSKQHIQILYPILMFFYH